VSRLALDLNDTLELNLAIAGTGSRAYAFVIDWHIRALLSFAWWLVAEFCFSTLQGNPFGYGGLQGSYAYTFVALVPAAAIYFLYHPVLEVLQSGRTPGKKMAGLRIVDKQGRTPSTAALLIRNALRIIDSLPSGYVVGLLCTVFSKDSVRVGDIAAGTLLVHERKQEKLLQESDALAHSHQCTPEQSALIRDLLERWDNLDPQKRTKMAYTILQRLRPDELLSMDGDQLKRNLRHVIRST
jgi:uncharacterized RDD family membrane protein YckC